jgi:hypothetical protein
MPKISKLTLTPELSLLVERYQQAKGIKTMTGALYELIARGYADFQREDDSAMWTETQEQEDNLFTEFDQQKGERWFALWYARRFAPKHGGYRDGAGRPKL